MPQNNNNNNKSKHYQCSQPHGWTPKSSKEAAEAGLTVLHTWIWLVRIQKWPVKSRGEQAGTAVSGEAGVNQKGLLF